MSQGIKSLVAQILGKRNVFGYSRTTINRIHLMHWLVGGFYYSNVFNRNIRISWGLFLLVNGLIMLGHSVFYIMFTSNLAFVKVLYSSEVMFAVLYFLILFPLVSYVNRNDAAEALKILDQTNDIDMELDKLSIVSIDVEFIKREKYGSKILLKILATQVGLGTCFFVCSNLHLLIGFTDDKLKEPDYYLYPTYCEKVDSLTAFIIMLLSQLIPSVAIVMMALLVPCFSVAATREFYHRFQSISDSMDHQSKLLTVYYEQLLNNRCRGSKEIPKYQRLFTHNVHMFGKHHQELLRQVNLLNNRGLFHFKKFLQFNMSAIVVMFLYNEVLLVYMMLLSGSFLTQMKAFNMAVGVCLILYVNCLIGKLFSDMGEMFSNSVYNMPWYYLSPLKRKSYLLLLYQAHVAIEFKAMKIYPADMTFFLRMCNYVYSIVNVLRRYYHTRYAA